MLLQQHAPNPDRAIPVQDILAAHCALYEPFQEWATLDHTATQSLDIPPLSEAMLLGWNAWSAPSSSTDDILACASSSVQAFGQSIRTCMDEAPQRMDSLVPQALANVSLQYILAHEIRRLMASWTQGQADMRLVVALCRSLQMHIPLIQDMLFLYLDPHEMGRALEATLSHMPESLWRNADELASTGWALLFLELIASHCIRTVPSTGEARAFFTLDVPVPGRESLVPVKRELLDRWCCELTAEQGISDTLLAASPPWTMHMLAPVILAQLLDAHQYTLIDTQTLHSAVSYFLQAPLRHTLPATLRWLATYVHQTHARAYYATNLHSHVCTCLDVLHMLLLSDACCPLVCALVMPAVLPLLRLEQLATIPGTAGNNLRTCCQLLEAKYERPRAAPSTWLAQALSRDASRAPLCRMVAKACSTNAHDTTTAHTWLSLMQCTLPDDTWAVQLLGTALVLAPPPAGAACAPLTLATFVLQRWDASRSTAEAVQSMTAVLSMSMALSKQLPGGAEAAQRLLYSFSGALPKALLDAL